MLSMDVCDICFCDSVKHTVYLHLCIGGFYSFANYVCIQSKFVNTRFSSCETVNIQSILCQFLKDQNIAFQNIAKNKTLIFKNYPFQLCKTINVYVIQSLVVQLPTKNEMSSSCPRTSGQQ